MPLPTPCEGPPKSTLFLVPDSTSPDGRLHCPVPSCNVCPSAAQLEAEILRAEERVLELKKNLVLLKSEINTHHDPLSLLPTEVVSEIFKFYCENRHARVTLRIGEVCKRWREVTLGTPQLWSTVSTSAHIDKPYDLDVAAEWLSRSRSLPLTLDIDFETEFTSTSPEYDSFSPLIQLLRSHSTRWRDVSLGGTFDADIIVPALFANLEKMPSNFGVLDLGTAGHSDDFECNSDTLLCPQTLRIFAGSHINGFPLGWERLTCLSSIDGLTLYGVLDIIESAPMLTECIVKFSEEEPMFVFYTSPIISHSITSLETNGGLDNLLNFLTLPSLETLTYGYRCHSPEDTDLHILHDFLDRSSPSLKNFHLTITPYQPNYINIWRTKDVSLTSLEFNTSFIRSFEGWTKITKAFMALLSTLIEDGTFPKLRSLKFRPATTPEFWSDLCDVIQKLVQIQSSDYYHDTDTSRPIACRREPLQSVVINLGYSTIIPESMDARVHSRLIEMASSGLKITVKEGEHDVGYPFHKLNVNLQALATN